MYDKGYMKDFSWSKLKNGNVGCGTCGSAAGNPFFFCAKCRYHKSLEHNAKDLTGRGYVTKDSEPRASRKESESSFDVAKRILGYKE